MLLLMVMVMVMLVLTTGGARLWVERDRVYRGKPGDQRGRQDPRGTSVVPPASLLVTFCPLAFGSSIDGRTRTTAVLVFTYLLSPSSHLIFFFLHLRYSRVVVHLLCG